jgi:hypothetical protein
MLFVSFAAVVSALKNARDLGGRVADGPSLAESVLLRVETIEWFQGEIAARSAFLRIAA